MNKVRICEKGYLGQVWKRSRGCAPWMALAVVVAMLCMTTRISAQAKYLGALSGVITDSAGARVPNANVSATDTTTKYVTKAVSDATGEYTIPFITPDTYDVTITAKGFGPQTKTGVVVTAGDTVDVSFALAVGTETSTMLVTADEAQLDTESGQVATTISTQEVVDTPLIGHNPFIFTTLGAGVYTGQYMQSKASSQANQFSGTAVQLVINGISGHVRLTLDGIPDDPAERFSGTNYLGFVPSMEGVQEVKVQNTMFDAQYGHGAGVENTVLRAGTNQYHGAAYYVFQNTYMDANTSERVPNQNAATSPTVRTNDQTSQPGFVIDGPASIPHFYNAHDKTYFMVTYERVQAKLPITSVATVNGIVPTAAQRTGDFSGLCSSFNASGICNAGSGQQLYDPTQPTAANGDRVPFLNNKIPASYFAAGTAGAPGAAMMALYPSPNVTPTPSAPNNYIPSSGFTYDEKYFSLAGRVDHSFSNTNKMNASFFKAILNQLVPNDNFPTPIGASGLDYTVYRNNVGGHLQDLWMVSPTLAVDAHVGLIYHPFGLVYKGLTYNVSSLGINTNGIAYQSFPGISFTDPVGGYLGLAAGAGGQVSTFALIAPGVVVSKTRGKHNLRVGFDSNFDRYDVQNPQSGFTTFNFNRQFTQKNSNTGNCPTGEICSVNGDSNSGNALAAMLVGTPNTGAYGNNVAYAMEDIYYAGFIQDDMRVSDKLTVNMGFRWDYESPFTERYNRLISNFCTTCVNPMQAQVSGLPLLGGLQFASYGNRTPYPKNYSNWQPRFGGSYQVARNTVVRGGFAVIYLNTLESPISTGYSASTSYVSTTDNIHPANYFNNPFPSGVVLPTGNALGLATALGQGVSFNDPSHVQPRDVEWSVSAEEQLPWNLLFTASYVGQKESREEVNKSINGLPIQYYNNASLATYLNTKVPNPMYGASLLPTSSSNATATILQSSLLVPFPEFTGVTDDYASVGDQLYNSLQLTAVKRMSRGFSVQGNFTWDKLMDQNSYLNAGQNSFNQTFRYQDSSPTMIENFIATYQIPTLVHSLIGRTIVGNWTLNTVLRETNGTLVSTPGGVTQLANPRISNPGNGKYFNTCYENSSGALVIGAAACANSSSTPAFQQLPSGFWLATIGPDMESVRFHVHPLLDASMFKKFNIYENVTFEIRGEVYNVANTPNWGNPSTSLGGSTFGTVSPTQANDPRILQLTGRFNF